MPTSYRQKIKGEQNNYREKREKRVHENHTKIQIAQIEAVKEQAKIDKELKIKEIELQAQQAQATTSSATTNKDAKSPKLPSFIDEKDELDSYLLCFERYAENASWEREVRGL